MGRALPPLFWGGKVTGRDGPLRTPLPSPPLPNFLAEVDIDPPACGVGLEVIAPLTAPPLRLPFPFLGLPATSTNFPSAGIREKGRAGNAFFSPWPTPFFPRPSNLFLSLFSCWKGRASFPFRVKEYYGDLPCMPSPHYRPGEKSVIPLPLPLPEECGERVSRDE